MDPIIKWKSGKYSRLVLPHEINFETMFQQHGNKIFGVCEIDCVQNHTLENYADVYKFLDIHPEYLFDGRNIGKILWNNVGTTYVIENTEYVVNVPSIKFPKLNNYVIQRLGPLKRAECDDVYNHAFFSDEKVVSLDELKQLLGNKNG